MRLFWYDQFVQIQGARAQEILSIFKPLQRSSWTNWSYPKDDELTAICHVSDFNRAISPLFNHFFAYFCHFAAKTTSFMSS